MEAVGLIGAVLGVIDVTTRCITSLMEIRQRLMLVNTSVELLCGQLCVVKAALGQIHDFIKAPLAGEQHYQLTLDLGVGTNCCNLLMQVIEEQLAKIQYNDTDEMTFASKVSLMLESKGTEDCLTRLDRQINALNLLITAFKLRTSKERQSFLKREQSRKAFDQIKDDSSSLIVLCDAASFDTRRTQTTTATSKLSMNFAFDAELLQAKAYKGTLRSLMRRNYKSRQSPATDPPRLPQSQVSSKDRAGYENPLHMIQNGLDYKENQLKELPIEWEWVFYQRDISSRIDMKTIQAHIDSTIMRNMLQIPRFSVNGGEGCADSAKAPNSPIDSANIGREKFEGSQSVPDLPDNPIKIQEEGKCPPTSNRINTKIAELFEELSDFPISLMKTQDKDGRSSADDLDIRSRVKRMRSVEQLADMIRQINPYEERLAT